jgi:hypothetical protein
MGTLSRMANRLSMSDHWHQLEGRRNATDPVTEATFIGFHQFPACYGRQSAPGLPALGLGIPETGRIDLVNALLKYPSRHKQATVHARARVRNFYGSSGRGSGCTVSAKAAFSARRRWSWMAEWSAPNDDVTDIALRVVAGADCPKPLARCAQARRRVNFNIGAQGNIRPTGSTPNFSSQHA